MGGKVIQFPHFEEGGSAKMPRVIPLEERCIMAMAEVIEGVVIEDVTVAKLSERVRKWWNRYWMENMPPRFGRRLQYKRNYAIPEERCLDLSVPFERIKVVWSTARPVLPDVVWE